MSDFEVRADPVLGEEVWLGRTAAGMPVRVVPTDRFREAMAVVSFAYGSTDLGFELDGSRHTSPEGVAHYLEHKLFEDEELNTFERFARRGAQVNAMTGFTRTTYYFQATSHLRDNLTDLLSLVATAHLTDENVEKERGIIAQEIRMYEDSADYRGFFDLLGCFYSEHPVRHPVGGTVASIADIDVAELSACHRAFYRTENAALAVAGPVDAEQVLELASQCPIPGGAAPRSVFPVDLGPVVARRGSSRMEVARPRLLLGFKDRELIADAEQRHRRELVTQVFLDRLFAAASDVREGLHQSGLVDDSLSCTYMSERSFGFVVVACETERPDEVAQALYDSMTVPVEVEEDHLERVRRKMLGQYVRSFDSIKRMSTSHCEEALEDIEPFGAIARMQAITLEDVVERQRELCREDSFALAVVEP